MEAVAGTLGATRVLDETARARTDRAWCSAAGVGGLYLLVSFLFFGLRLVFHTGPQWIGPFDDPLVAIWDLAWVPHALLHGENPFVTHALWAPTGVNLTWATSVLGLGVVFAPVTLLFGPVAGYDTAMVVLPALTAWTAYVLCRRLTGALWPSLVGGYLFGFSSFMVGQKQGHMHTLALFLIPLAAIAAWRYLEGEIGGRGLALRLGSIVAAQLYISTEIVFTLSLALFGGMVLAWLVAPQRRPRLVSMLGPVVGAYMVAALLAAPFLYFLAKGLHTSSFTPPQYFGGDLVNLVVPTHLQLLGIGWADHLTSRFPGNRTEQGLFVGPALVIVVLYAWRRRWGAGHRFLYGALGIALLATLGTSLHVYGHSLVRLPWAIVQNQPIWDNVLPLRIVLYVWLAVAVIVALWTARQRHVLLRYLLPVLVMAALVPNVAAPEGATGYAVPPFFTSSAYRSCLHPGETILPIPIGDAGESDLWQASDDFRFRMAGGRIQITPPSAFMHPSDIELISQDEPVSPNQTALFRNFIRVKGVEAVVVDPLRGQAFVPALDRIAKPQSVGGILLYRVAPTAPSCAPRA